MSFDLFAQQQQIIDRLTPVLGAVPLYDTFSRPDMTDAGMAPVAAHLVFAEFSPEGQVGRSARHFSRWSFDLYVDTARASEAQKASAAACFSAAMGALIGWDFSLGREVQSAAGQESGHDGRVLRISFGFVLPVFLAG